MKITFPELTARVALQSGEQKKTTEEFLKVVFQTIASQLEEGEMVKVPGLGTFKLIVIEARKSVNVNTGEEFEIPSHRRVSFVPVKELAEKVNAPFEAFQAVEIPEDNAKAAKEETPAIAKEQDAEPASATAAAAETESAAEETLFAAEEKFPKIHRLQKPVTPPPPPPAIPVEEVAEPAGIPGQEEEKAPVSDTPEDMDIFRGEETAAEAQDGEVPAVPPVPVMPEESQELLEAKPRKGRFGWGFLIGFLSAAAVIAILLFIGCVFYRQGIIFGEKTAENVPQEKAEPVAAPEVEEEETDSFTDEAQVEPQMEGNAAAVAPPTEPTTLQGESGQPEKEEVVYDYITKTRYLTTMAKAHYGNYHLWPYIYKENEKMLGHPDRIKPGTRIVIPDLKKYGVDPNSKADIEKAKKLGVEIYKKYQ